MMTSTSNSRLSLELIPLSDGKQCYKPNDTIQVQLKVLKQVLDYTEPIELFLVGISITAIMGKDRWQIGVMSNVGSGGSAALVTSQERHEFLRSPFNLVSPDSVTTTSHEKKRAQPESTSTKVQGGIYEAILPQSTTGEILPTFIQSTNDMAGVGVKYYIELIGHRKGFLKTNDKLTIEIPVTIPRHALPKDQPYSTVTGTRDLKYQGSEGSLFIEATIAHLPVSTFSPFLDYTLTIIPSPGASSLLSTPPTLISSLSRRVRTIPIDQPGNGQPFDWAGIRLASGKMTAQQISSEEISRGVMKWSGRVPVESGQRTVNSAGLVIRYMIGVAISHPALTSSLTIKLPVFIPSSTELLEGEGDGDYDVYHHQDALPDYTA